MSLEIKHRVLPTQAKAVRADLARLGNAVAGAKQLAPGSTGPAVEALQRMLRGLDLYSGDVSGTYDAATQAAVTRLEGQASVATPDGIFDGKELAEVRSRQLYVKDDFQTPAKIGQKGTDIKGLENKLHDLGYHTGKIDGVYDAATEKAVRAYRRDDKDVSDKFHGAGNGVIRGLRGEIRDLEGDLKKLGREPGKVDSFYTAKTAAAVKAFQRKHDLKPTGIANLRTRNALDKAAAGGITPRTQKFIDVAKAQVGANYVFGAAGPSTFDCSGLIHYALEKAGVNDARTSADGYMQRYQDHKVSRANLKPGDLVFFHYPNTRGIPAGHASHIEIYLGHGMTMGTDNTTEDARIEPIDWSAFIGGARVPGLQH